MYPVPAPTTGVEHLEGDCKANINRESYGEGSLYVAQSELIWRNASGNGIRLQYPDIAVHAVSKDTQAFPEECLYVMYNRSLLNIANQSVESDEESESSITEIRFIPQNKDHLGKMFDAMSDCQCLHPDDDDSDFCPEEEEGYEEGAESYEDGATGEGFYTGEEGLSHMTQQGLATMQRLEAMLAQQQTPTDAGDGIPNGVSDLHITETNSDAEGQFDDAEMP